MDGNKNGYALGRVTEEEFRRAFSIAKDAILLQPAGRDRQAVLLGGQPGAGKSTLYGIRNDLQSFLAINGDALRYYHPRCREVFAADPYSFVPAIRAFCVRLEEELIADLATEGYNMVIEGTFRTTEVPLNTASFLASCGYRTEVSFLVCDAEVAWQSNVARAKMQKERGLYPRLLPLEAYDRIAMALPENLQTVLSAGMGTLFSGISMYDRAGRSLYADGDNPSGILRSGLDLAHWRAVYPIYEREYPLRCAEIFGRKDRALDEREER